MQCLRGIIQFREKQQEWTEHPGVGVDRKEGEGTCGMLENTYNNGQLYLPQMVVMFFKILAHEN